MKSVDVEATALTSFGWGEAAVLTSVGEGGASAFSLCAFDWDEATALTKFGAGGPTISEGSGERVATALTSLGAGVGVALTTFGEGEVATLASVGEGCGFTAADESRGDTVPGVAFGRTTLVVLEFPAGDLKPLLGPKPENVLAVAFW